MLVVFLKIAVIFCMVAIGFVANKTKVLPIESNKYLVNLLLVITTPCMIIGSMASKDLTEDTFLETIQVLIGSVIFFVAAAFVSLIIVKALRYTPQKDQGILMVIITAVNTGFMGFPVTKAIFGDEYFFLMVVENIVLTIYLYFIAVIQMNYGHERKNNLKEILKPLCNMCTYAAILGLIILFAGIKVPETILDFLNTVGDATIPVSMIVVGVQLGNSNLKKMIRNGKLIFVSVCNVIVIPLLTFFAVNWLPLTTPAKVILVFASAFPCAVVTVAVASRENKNADLMAEGVAITTLLSLATLPIIAMFLLSYYL